MLDHLRRAEEPACAAADSLASPGLRIGFTHGSRAADRALVRKNIRFCVLWPLFQYRPKDLRNDISRALHPDRIANADVLAGDLIFVVKRRIGDHNAANRDGIEICNW